MIKTLDKDVIESDEELKKLLLGTPNLPHASVPIGKDENDNIVARVVGEKPCFSFKPKEHTDIGESLGIIDFERAGKLAGARFSLMKGAGRAPRKGAHKLYARFAYERAWLY